MGENYSGIRALADFIRDVVKYQQVPNCTYLKLKLPGPNGVITLSGSFEQAYVSSREYFDLATTAANSAELG